MGHREVGVEHHPIGTVIARSQKTAIAGRELVAHPASRSPPPRSAFDCPEKGIAPELVSGAMCYLAASTVTRSQTGVRAVELQDVDVVAENLDFPEGPVAMADGSVVVVEINAGRVSRCSPDGSRSVVAEVGGGPNGAARGPDGALYICNNGGPRGDERRKPCIQRVDPATGSVDVLYTEAAGEPLRAPNDLVFDNTGNFWFTDIVAGAIFYASPEGTSIDLAIDQVPAPNGIGLSPDGTVLYWAQTFTRQVMRRLLDGPGHVVPSAGCNIQALIQNGSVDHEALLLGLPGAQELDSLAVEQGGTVCVGTLVDSGITAVSGDGSAVEKFTLPEQLADGAVTNICFGGDDLRTAFITLSLTGRLVSCRWPRPGLRLHFQE